MTKESYISPNLMEASLTRVWQHISSGRPWVIITAWRPEEEKSQKQNYADNDTLKREAQKRGWGSFYVKGYWETDSLLPDGGVRNTKDYEDSLFIVPEISGDQESNFLNWVKEKISEYNQTSAIYGDKSGIRYVYSDGHEQWFSKTKYNDGKMETPSPEEMKELIQNAKEKGETFLRGRGYSQLKDKQKREFRFEGLYCTMSANDMASSNFRKSRLGLVETIKKITKGE